VAEIGLDTRGWTARRAELCTVLLIFVIGGLFGFFYEELFYLLNDYLKEGVWRLQKRGNTFGPWIQIYGYGAVLIHLTTKKLRRRPALVFLTAGAVCGSLEYFTGLALDQCFHVRFWDYNVEIWNWGNLNGYICIRSVLVFASAGLLLQYLVCPILDRVRRRIAPGTLTAVSMVLAGLCVLDIVSSIISRTIVKG